MELPRTAMTVPRLRILERAGSTNDEAMALAATPSEPDFSTVVTLDQTRGRGRLGRQWVAPAGKTLAASVLIRPATLGGGRLRSGDLGWLPLIAGAALASVVDSLVGGGRTVVKWPNDVLIDDRKVCGVLVEFSSGGEALVIGTGVNLTLTAGELPVHTATSLALAGVTVSGSALVDTVLSGYLAELRELLERFVVAEGDAESSGIRRLVSERCGTLGRDVRVVLPGADDLVGVATGIDTTGRLLVRSAADGTVRAVAAGDVTHLRYE